LDDATSAYTWLLEQGFDPRHLSIGGDSAGGGLAVSTALHLKEHGIPLPAALFLISPWTDLTFSGNSVVTRKERDPVLSLDDEWLQSAYAGAYPLDHPLVSPLFADHHGLPPTLLQVGSEEILYDDSARLAEKLNLAGVMNQFETWDGMWHVFQGFAPYIPEAQSAIDRIGEFLNRYLG
jgi:acetyl esterase/lipase